MPSLLSFLGPAFEAINQPTSWWSFATGVVAVAVAVIVTRARRAEHVEPFVAGLVGLALALVVATLGSPARVAASASVVWSIVAASAILLVSSLLPTLPRLGLLAVGSAPMLLVSPHAARDRDLGDVLSATSIAAAVATFVLAVALMATTRHGGAPRVFPPITLAAVGVFLCLPETNASLAAIGFLAPVAIWSVTPAGAGSTWRAASASLAPPLVAIVVLGLAPNEGRVFVGGLACLATAVVWCAVRVARRAPPGPPRIAWWFLSLGVGIAAVGIARGAVIRAPLERTIAGSLIGLAGLATWCVAGEVLARRRDTRRLAAGHAAAP